VSDLRAAGPEVIQLLHLLDQIEDDLRKLEHDGVDIRAEQTRFDTVQRQLRRRKRRFLSEVRGALEEERSDEQPAHTRWWWYLDQRAAKERRQKLLRIALGAGAIVALLIVVWLAYERFIAPPPSVRTAFRQIETGKAHVQEGNLQAGIEAFEAATGLMPDDAEAWLWKGVLHSQTGQPAEAEDAFSAGEALHESRCDFLLNRGRIYLQVGDVKRAEADAKTAIAECPDSGWGYYLQAGIAVQRKDYAAALAHVNRAAELAQEVGDAQLEAMARTQQARLTKMVLMPTAAP
jgi:tetratricopeptide (TPR) repeat protein